MLKAISRMEIREMNRRMAFITHPSLGTAGTGLLLDPPVPEAVHRFDGVEFFIGLLELPPKPLDVAVDGAVADVSVVRITLARQLLASLHMAGMPDKGMQHHELGHGEIDRRT